MISVYGEGGGLFLCPRFWEIFLHISSIIHMKIVRVGHGKSVFLSIN